MIKLALFLILGLLLNAVAFAWQEPTGVAGVPWGASEQNLQKKVSVRRCSDFDHVVLPSRYCTGNFTFGGHPVLGTFRFRNGGLVSVNFAFPQYRFKDMKRSFIEEYGPPDQERKEEKWAPEESHFGTIYDWRRAPQGLHYTNEVVVWIGNRVQINLAKSPVGPSSDSEAFIMTTDELIRQTR